MKRFNGLIAFGLVLALGGLFATGAAAQCEGSCPGKSGSCGDATAKACPDGGSCAKSCGSGCETATASAEMCCPFSQCLVSGKKLAGVEKPAVYNEGGRTIYFADAESLEKFKANKEAYLKKYDAAVIKAGSMFYPVDYCVVSGDTFSKDVKPVDRVYQNRLVRFCGEACAESFNKEPAKYIKVLDQAVVKAQKPHYPLQVCPVSGHELGSMGEAYDVVYANVLVRFCCNGCVPAFNKNPAKYMAALHEGWQKQHEALKAPAAGTAKATSMAGN